ncbi:hypothetical protein GCM10027610_026830 [Dactylosporangium cerinum]
MVDTIGFLVAPEATAAAQRMLDEDLAELGFVMNVSRLWGYQPATMQGLFDLIGQANATDRLSLRQRGILVVACASAAGDSYCALSWGGKLAGVSDAGTAAGVIAGTDDRLTDAERVMADWARKVARTPNATTAEDVQRLRDAGFTDSQVFTMTVFVALRLAFATVNDALGARPDRALHDTTPPAVREAITFGRPVDEA